MNYPKRRKSKDNPYNIGYNQEKEIFVLTFKDVNDNICCVEINYDLYNLFNEFELNDLKQLNEFDRHIEHLNIMQNDELVFKRILNKQILTEELVEKKLQEDSLILAIKKLPKIQRRRIIKYYFEDKTFDDIALEEGCSKVAVKYSIDVAISNLKKILKK